jgi:hypothetical protein
MPEGERMSDIDQKRDYVEGLYTGPGWKVKVRKMSDAQVVAIYLRETNKAKDRAANKPKPEKPKESGSDDIPF